MLIHLSIGAHSYTESISDLFANGAVCGDSGRYTDDENCKGRSDKDDASPTRSKGKKSSTRYTTPRFSCLDLFISHLTVRKAS